MTSPHRKTMKKDESAEVGIGTMIVFIATILVAATAAGVLINTSQKLQAKSSQTGNDAVENVASTLQVVGVVGSRFDTSEGNLTQVAFRIQLASGADPVDLSKLVLQYSDGQNETQYAFVAGTNPTAGKFLVNCIRETGTSCSADNVMVSGDFAELIIGDDSAAGPSVNAALGSGSSVTATLVPQHGNPVSVGFTAPDSYVDKLFVTLF